MSDNNDVAADLLEDYGFHEQAFRLRRLWRFEQRLANIRGNDDWPLRLFEGQVFALVESADESEDAYTRVPLYAVTEIQRVNDGLLMKARPFGSEP